MERYRQRPATNQTGSEITWESTEGSARILWVTGACHPNIGIIFVPALAEVQILCDDYTFDAVDMEVLPDFVEKLVTGDVSLKKRGLVLKALVLRVTSGGKTYEAGRSAKGQIADWERRLLALSGSRDDR